MPDKITLNFKVDAWGKTYQAEVQSPASSGFQNS